MVYIKDSISYIKRDNLEITGLECIWIQIKLCNKRNILYGVFYRPPNAVERLALFVANLICASLLTSRHTLW